MNFRLPRCNRRGSTVSFPSSDDARISQRLPLSLAILSYLFLAGDSGAIVVVERNGWKPCGLLCARMEEVPLTSDLIWVWEELESRGWVLELVVAEYEDSE